MNRLASAFSNAPSSSSSETVQQLSQQRSPLESTFSAHSDGNRRKRSSSPPVALYDDPRQIYATNVPSWGQTLTLSRRPGLLRHKTDDGISRSTTPRPGRDRVLDQSVKVNVLAEGESSKRGWGMNTLPGSGRITAMVSGPNGMYAVGGGQYMRVLQIKSPPSGDTTPVLSPEPLAKGVSGSSITEVVNLWKGQWGVSRGVNDLDWGVAAQSSKIVSACPSGNILIYDLNKPRQVQEITGGHPRPMNVLRLCKNPNQSHLLISGGTEGQAKIWDLRDANPALRKFFKHSVPITSLAFSPDMPNHFLVGLDNGSIQRYDLRNHLKAIGRVWGAHGNKAVMDLKWKEGDDKGWLASAGADRTVQIWDMSIPWDRPPAPIHTLHTAYPVKRVQWRPGHDTELAIIPSAQPLSSASVDPSIASIPQGLDAHQYQADDDAHIEIWDVRRHYIAKYAIESHDGAAIALDWSGEDTIVTAFQNGTFAQSGIHSQKALPIETIPRNVTAWNKRGEMAYAIDRFRSGEIPFDDLKPEFSSHWDKVGQKQKSLGDDPYYPLQAVGVMPPIEIAAEEDHLGYVSEKYRLEGDTPGNLCAWNSEVAASCGRTDDARFWTFLRLFMEEFSAPAPVPFTQNVFAQSQPAKASVQASPRGATVFNPSSPKPIPLERLEDAIDDVEELLSTSGLSNSSSGSETDRPTTPQRARFIAFAPVDNRRLSETIAQRNSPVIPSASHSARATPRTLFAQAVGASGRLQASTSSHSTVINDYPDPYGVIPTSSARGSKGHNDYPDPYGITNKSDSSRPSTGSKKPSPLMNPIRSVILPSKESLGPAADEKDREGEYDKQAWNRYKEQRAETLLKWWKCYVDDGEVQMATAIFVIGRALIDFPEVQCERIAHAYLDMLEANRLYNAAAYVRRHGGIPSLEVRTMDEGVSHVVHCARCRKSTGPLDAPIEGSKFWWCKHCERTAKTCVICHRGVQGLWMSCGKCKHGGHQKCMRVYFMSSNLHSSPTSIPPAGPVAPKPNKSQRPSSPHTPIASSHESSGFDRVRTSHETFIDTVIPEEGEKMERKWNVCAKGCGCACRIVVSAVPTTEDV